MSDAPISVTRAAGSITFAAAAGRVIIGPLLPDDRVCGVGFAVASDDADVATVSAFVTLRVGVFSERPPDTDAAFAACTRLLVPSLSVPIPFVVTDSLGATVRLCGQFALPLQHFPGQLERWVVVQLAESTDVPMTGCVWLDVRRRDDDDARVPVQ